MVLIAVTIPLAIIFWFSESIFLMLKQDPEVARYAGKYVHVQMISLFFIGQFDLTKRFLMQVQVAWVPFFANIVCTALHLLWLYILIVRMNLEIVGAGIAMATTGFLLLSSVTAVSYFIPSIRPALFCPNADSFTKWGEYLSISLPIMVMICAESWAMEAFTILSGYVGVADQAA